MPTRNKRYYVSLPKNIEDFILREAEAECLPVSTHITRIVRKHVHETLMLYASHRESQEQQVERHIFDTPPRRPVSPSKVHVNQGSNKAQ